MTIQLPVVIWTIINFILLSVMLDFLLFRPMYGFMHARRERLDSARAKRLAAEQKKAENEEKRLIALKESEALAAVTREELIDKANVRAKERIAEASREASEERETGMRENSESASKVQSLLDSSLDEFARKFAENLTGR